MKQSSPTAQQHQHLPSELPETAPNEPREDPGVEAVVSDDGVGVGVGVGAAGPAETGTGDESAPQEEVAVSLRVSTGPGLVHARASPKTGVKKEGVAAPETAGELPGTEGVVGGGQREQEEPATATECGPEQAEVENIAPASGAAELGEHGGLEAGAKEELGGGGEVSGESGDGGAGSDAEVEASAEVEKGEKIADVEFDKPGTAAATRGEPETIIGNDTGGGEVVSGGVAEDFFAGDDSSSEDDELYPGAAAAAAGGTVGTVGAPSVGSDQDREPPVGEQPPSPRIIASSVQRGFRSLAATQRNETAAAVGEEGISEAAKAAVAAAFALASAASATSRRGVDDSSKSRKKKKSHKERRRKRSGSKSAGEDDSGVGSRGSGSVGRSEVDGNGRTKRSSSGRHHRKSAVG